MSRRPALVTQADVSRAIRAVKAAGLPVFGVLVTKDGVLVRTTEQDNRQPWEREPVAHDEEEDFVL